MTPHMQQKLQATLLTFRDIAAPLMNAVTETGGINANVEGRAEHTPENHAALFSDLMELTAKITKNTLQQLGLEFKPEYDWVRWQMAVTTAQVVGAYYRATAAVMPIETADVFIPAMMRAGARFAEDVTPVVPPASSASDVEIATKSITAMVPVISSIARFAFGRSENELIVDIASHLRGKVLELAGQLAPAGCNDADLKKLQDGLLESLGKIYAEAHYAEMDRLLDMAPDERAKYIRSHDNKPPMEPVWEAFKMRTDMLTIVAHHIVLADGAQVLPPA